VCTPPQICCSDGSACRQPTQQCKLSEEPPL
jgi:hypothetical protein